MGDGPFKEALHSLASLVVICPDIRHLIHADLLNYNVFVSDGRVSGVIDWGCSMYGDYLYDIAMFSYWAPWYSSLQHIDFHEQARVHYASIGLEVPHLDERLRCYEVHIGLDAQIYSAFKGRWEEIERRAERTLQIARGDV